MSKKDKVTDTRPFSEKHPRWNFFIGLLLFLGMIAGAIAIAYYVIKFISHIVSSFVEWISTVATTLDAVVIVALITGAVSIVGVIISSIVAKSLEYRKARREYLAQKREKPYGEFVDMVYKIQQNGKNGNKYTQDEMIKDLMTFSKEITLWGSPSVVNKWVKFKENGMKNGGLVGFLYIVLVYLIGSLTSGSFALTSQTITTIIFNILLGMIGGIVGVNLTNK